MSTELAAAQDSVTNFHSELGTGSHLAPDLQRGSLPTSKDGQAALPSVEVAGAASRKVADLKDPCNFLGEVAKNFTRIDQNQDQVISGQEIADFRSRPNIGARQLEMSNILLSHWNDFVGIGGNQRGLDSSGIKHLARVTYPHIEEFNPSFTGTVARGTAGGAAGGAVVSAWNGDSVKEGAGTGAAIGATIGVVAYSVAKANYNELVRHRATVNSWNYFELGGNCNVPSDAPESAVANLLKRGTNSEIGSNSLLRSSPRSDAELKELVPLIRDFSDNTFGKIDFDRDSKLTKAELAEGLSGEYIPQRHRKFAEILYSNHAQMAGVSSPYAAIDRSTLGRLSEAADRDAVVAKMKSEQRQTAMTGGVIGAAAGFWGGVFLVAGSKIPGWGLPATMAGLAAVGYGIGYFANRPGEVDFDNRQKALRETAFANTISDLRTLR